MGIDLGNIPAGDHQENQQRQLPDPEASVDDNARRLEVRKHKPDEHVDKNDYQDVNPVKIIFLLLIFPTPTAIF